MALAIDQVHQEVKAHPPPGHHYGNSGCAFVHYALNHLTN
jgi:hypothetical protein